MATDFSRFETDSIEDVVAKLSWYLELTAEQIDIWFPDDKEPAVQQDLRRLAGVLQKRFGFESVREMLGPEKAALLLDDVVRAKQDEYRIAASRQDGKEQGDE